MSGVQPNSPATKAGIKVGDVITAIDGKKLKDSAGARPTSGRHSAEHKIQTHLSPRREGTNSRSHDRSTQRPSCTERGTFGSTEYRQYTDQLFGHQCRPSGSSNGHRRARPRSAARRPQRQRSRDRVEVQGTSFCRSAGKTFPPRTTSPVRSMTPQHRRSSMLLPWCAAAIRSGSLRFPSLQADHSHCRTLLGVGPYPLARSVRVISVPYQ